ncbi:hypothetical protein N8289_03600 [Flavobacteriales bacterium]|jgi:hypothetical protein|nr:hypothetical protein [Flavobacteriales bacterium]MDB9932483.1 hypothetical protein [Flavobacteriales bacterium]MDC0015237.1 hypothetical protein [Flavobacteriales bacterium]MDC1370906.1 hypothetical protein [Flavobacteriales bacterium]
MSEFRTFGIVVIMLFAFGCTMAQSNENASSKKVVAKVFGNTNVTLGSSDEFISMLKTFSPSISWGNDYGNFQEVEMTSFKLAFAENNFKFDNSWQYTYNFRLAKDFSNKKVNYYFGAGLNAGYRNYNYQIYNGGLSNIGDYYIDKYKSIDLNIVAVPRVTIDLGERFMIDINGVFNVYSHKYSNTNSNYSEPTSNSVGDVFPNKFTIKVGVAYKF